MLTLFIVVLAYFFPFGDAAVWPMHAVCVFIFDILTPGACANPAFTVGLYVCGKFDAYTVMSKFMGQFWALHIAFTLMGAIPFSAAMLARRYDGRPAACPACPTRTVPSPNLFSSCPAAAAPPWRPVLRCPCWRPVWRRGL
jgi:hypothetical protein